MMAAEIATGRRGALVSLSICFGLVGLDRFIINPLFPVIARDLGLGYREIGLITAALALAWGVSAIFMGRLTDRIGIKVVLIASIVLFSLLAGLGGVATGLVSLMAIRGLLGLVEGAFVPACILATTRLSPPSRVGLNIGLQHMAASLCGFAIAPLLAAQSLEWLPSWRWVFVLVALPGLLMAVAVYKTLPPQAIGSAALPAPSPSRRAMLGRREVLANALAMSCWLSSITTLGALLPSYLIDHRHLALTEMGTILSGQGIGGVIGMLVIPALGDRIGHRRVAMLATGLKLAALTSFCLIAGDGIYLFVLLFLIGLSGSGVVASTVGPLTSGSVQPAQAATATGLVVGVGEILGGALSPALAGYLAARFGIAIVPFFALAAVTAGLLALVWGGRSRGAASR